MFLSARTAKELKPHSMHVENLITQHITDGTQLTAKFVTLAQQTGD